MNLRDHSRWENLISVLILSLTFYGASLSAQTRNGRLTILWEANTESDLAGYRLYYGKASRQYTHRIDVGNHTEYTIQNLDPDSRYYLAVTAYDLSNNESDYSQEVSAFPDTGFSSASTSPDLIVLYQNYPNPFNPATTIPYQLSQDDVITLRILNPTGQTVRILVHGKKSAGYHRARWEGKNGMGKRVSSGIYFVRLETSTFQLTCPIVLFH